MTQSDHLRRVRFWLAVFIIGLVLSGVTAFPLETELSLLVSIFHAGWLRPISEFTGMLPCLGDHLKTGHLWSVQNRPGKLTLRKQQKKAENCFRRPAFRGERRASGRVIGDVAFDLLADGFHGSVGAEEAVG